MQWELGMSMKEFVSRGVVFMGVVFDGLFCCLYLFWMHSAKNTLQKNENDMNIL